IATSALGELARRGGTSAGRAAEKILTEPMWDRFLTAYAMTCDRYLTSYAMTCLYRLKGAETIPRLDAVLQTSDDPEVVGAAVQVVLSDPQVFREAVHKAFVERVVEKARRITPADG